jgi:hypothetical protein
MTADRGPRECRGAYSPAGRMQHQWAFVRGASSSDVRGIRIGFRMLAIAFLTAMHAGRVLSLV